MTENKVYRNVLMLVKIALKLGGFDGLCNDECGCPIDDIAPCGEINGECVAGYLGIDEITSDFGIYPEKEVKEDGT